MTAPIGMKKSMVYDMQARELAKEALLNAISQSGPLEPDALIERASANYDGSPNDVLFGWHQLLIEGVVQWTREGQIAFTVKLDEEAEVAVALEDLRVCMPQIGRALYRHEIVQLMRPSTKARRAALRQALSVMTDNQELVYDTLSTRLATNPHADCSPA